MWRAWVEDVVSDSAAEKATAETGGCPCRFILLVCRSALLRASVVALAAVGWFCEKCALITHMSNSAAEPATAHKATAEKATAEAGGCCFGM
jgi:hypothetical protein